jgi:hypothetical protein
VIQSIAVSLFGLRLQSGNVESWPSHLGQAEIHPQVFVDGHHLDEPHLVSLPALIDSLHHDGAAGIFTCGCGEPGCDGIFEGIGVRHEAGLVHWAFRRPQSARGFADLSAWRAASASLHLTFDREQMLAEVQQFLHDARSLVGPNPHRFCWPVYGFYVKDLQTIDPTRPYYELSGTVLGE